MPGFLQAKLGYHELSDVALLAGIIKQIPTDTRFTFRFDNFFHPHVNALAAALDRGGIDGMIDAAADPGLVQPFFDARYQPHNDALTAVKSHPREIDLSAAGPYAGYNWELLFHVPFTVAVNLTKSGRYAEAQRWFHYIFNPLSTDMSVSSPARYWRFLGFRTGHVRPLVDLLKLLSSSPADLSDADADDRQAALAGYQAILAHPFSPFAVARTRPAAFQYAVLMRYLDNLIAWGDSLFAQDTTEAINEASMLYVLASDLLGPKPQREPPSGTVRPRCYAELAGDRDALGNALVDLEAEFPFNMAASSAGAAPAAGPLFGVGRTFYFCIGANPKLLGYWDIVADRLYKIRHCMNIAGVVRPLALFDPPIDPGLLVKGAAAGLDLGALAGSSRSDGPSRAAALIARAGALAGETRQLGAALLAAIEKGDAAALQQFRQKREAAMADQTRNQRFLQWKAAEHMTDALLAARAALSERLAYYAGLLELPNDLAAGPLALDRRELTEANFDEAYAALVGRYTAPVVSQPIPARPRAGLSPQEAAGATGAGLMSLSANEAHDLMEMGPKAHGYREAAVVADATAQLLALMPDFGVNIHFWGLGGNSKIIGGSTFAAVAHIVANSLGFLASAADAEGASAVKSSAYALRTSEWTAQYNNAAADLRRHGQDILGALVAEQVARAEYHAGVTQADDSREVVAMIAEAFTGEELYGWMQDQLGRMHDDCCTLALDVARRAEHAAKRALARPEFDAQSFIRPTYRDAGRRGLLAGDMLALDVQRLEAAFADNDWREHELVRNVSLRRLAPFALMTLRATGRCEFDVPEWLFDRDTPGHYLRRLRGVALTIPSIVGPYTSVNAKLSLLSHTTRISPIAGDDYARDGLNDPRFDNGVGAIETIVTSSATADSGTFEASGGDGRPLPFEGSGAIGRWRIELPARYRAFDYTTITDVILHLRHTARLGVPEPAVQTALDTWLGAEDALSQLVTPAADFPIEWNAFVNGRAPLTLPITSDLFPYFTQGSVITITSVTMLSDAQPGKQRHVGDPSALTDQLAAPGGTATLTIDPATTGQPPLLTRDRDAGIALMIGFSLTAP